MTPLQFEGPDAERDRLRALITAIGDRVSTLEGEPTRGAETEAHKALLAALRGSYVSLVSELALGPAPQLRKCPICGHLGMRAATLCGYCWTKLSPLPPGDKGWVASDAAS